MKKRTTRLTLNIHYLYMVFKRSKERLETLFWITQGYGMLKFVRLNLVKMIQYVKTWLSQVFPRQNE